MIRPKSLMKYTMHMIIIIIIIKLFSDTVMLSLRRLDQRSVSPTQRDHENTWSFSVICVCLIVYTSCVLSVSHTVYRLQRRIMCCSIHYVACTC